MNCFVYTIAPRHVSQLAFLSEWWTLYQCMHCLVWVYTDKFTNTKQWFGCTQTNLPKPNSVKAVCPPYLKMAYNFTPFQSSMLPQNALTTPRCISVTLLRINYSSNRDKNNLLSSLALIAFQKLITSIVEIDETYRSRKKKYPIIV